MSSQEIMITEEELIKSLRLGEFELYYQPIVDSDTMGIKSVEALIRWNHPEYGLIYPDSFMSILEDDVLGLHINEFVVKEACGHLQEWHDEGYKDLEVSINISPNHFLEDEFYYQIKELFRQITLSPNLVNIEITERSLVEKYDGIDNMVRKFRNKGFNISLDDFGIGYSSLYSLKKIDFNCIKVDKLFIDEITFNSKAYMLFYNMMLTGVNAGCDIVIEGVENSQQLETMIEIIKEIQSNNYWIHENIYNQKIKFQGYFFSRPIPKKEMDSLLHNHLRDKNKDKSKDFQKRFA